MSEKQSLPLFEFITLCSLVFMAVCNNSVYYSLNVYLQQLDFTKSLSGLLISVYSLSGMFMYATVSNRITAENAYRFMFKGMVMVCLCGCGYLFIQGFWPLLMLRIGQGVGLFMVLAPCVAILVSMVSQDNVGSAFSLYSTALLLPYAVMPHVSELFGPLVESPAWIYAGTAGLIPVAFLLTLFLRFRTSRMEKQGQSRGEALSAKDSYANLRRLKIFSVLMVNGVYFMIFNGLFFLFQDFAHSRGIYQAGYFFSLQMGVMIAIRLFGGNLFDRFSKRGLIVTAFVFTAGGFVLLNGLHDESMLLPIAVVFGIGMGLSAPALNSLMFVVSEPRFRSFNVNMMMFTVHMGSFLGPLIGGIAVDSIGYSGFLWIAAAGTSGTALAFLLLGRVK
ncbi:MFS transporter [Maridesulfovibrio salexigens]|uniref:Major facilitator superfamily MFS_1 n=1 Tax=Maridesulfovibrio salexigens (strain ATCC 14822 / DSM 2638 / NCIMB 8403 / VKM B-1763) TaxID=526222 RepID=C6C220_MARSD|nr:MFS transporter [Maridesulfovibrio salexigens]ACS81221.1 major facilitator superfamily MFS_1 [Maridesulfovibrio salexigens DSM 2638]